MERRYVEIISLLIFGILLFYSLKVLMPVFDALVIGLVLAYMVRPINNIVGKKVHNTSVCVILSMMVLLIPLIIVGLVISTEMISSFKSNDISGMIDRAFLNIDEIIDSATEQLFGFARDDVDDTSQQVLDQISLKISEYGVQTYEFIFDVAKGIPMLLFTILLSAVMCFYFVRDGARLEERISDVIPDQNKKKFESLLKSIDIMFQAVIIGYIFKAIFTGILATIVFYFFGIEEYLLLGILTGILDFIPLIGPWIVELLLCAWYIYKGEYLFAVAFISVAYIVISFIPEMYIRPRISGSAANIHPAIMLIGAIGGLMAYGAIGIILGPMLLSVSYVIIRIYFNDKPYEQIHFGYRDIFLNLFRRR